MFGTWANGSNLNPPISTKFKFSFLVNMNTRINSLIDIRLIKAIQYKLFILAFTIVYYVYILFLVNIILQTLVFFGEFILL